MRLGGRGALQWRQRANESLIREHEAHSHSTKLGRKQIEIETDKQRERATRPRHLLSRQLTVRQQWPAGHAQCRRAAAAGGLDRAAGGIRQTDSAAGEQGLHHFGILLQGRDLIDADVK